MSPAHEGTEVHGTPPRRGLGPLGASDWAWHGYSTSWADAGGRRVAVVSGGAHWGGGLVISARDLARIGQLYLDGGLHAGRRLLSREWVDLSWTPCPVKAEYGYLWWLNDGQVPSPGAPATGRSARGNGGRHLLWVDPARRLVLTSRWTEDPLGIIRDVSRLVPVHA